MVFSYLSSYTKLSLCFVLQELESICYDAADFDGLPFDFYGGYIGYIGYASHLYMCFLNTSINTTIIHSI